MECFKCGETGHMSRECPNQANRQGGGGDRTCFNCNQPGHQSRECPEPRKPRQPKTEMDTGFNNDSAPSNSGGWGASDNAWGAPV